MNKKQLLARKAEHEGRLDHLSRLIQNAQVESYQRQGSIIEIDALCVEIEKVAEAKAAKVAEAKTAAAKVVRPVRPAPKGG